MDLSKLNEALDKVFAYGSSKVKKAKNQDEKPPTELENSGHKKAAKAVK